MVQGREPAKQRAGTMGRPAGPRALLRPGNRHFLPSPPSELPATHRAAGRPTWVYRKNPSRKCNPQEKSLSGACGGGTVSGSHKEQCLDTGAAESGLRTPDSHSAVTLYGGT